MSWNPEVFRVESGALAFALLFFPPLAGRGSGGAQLPYSHPGSAGVLTCQR
jgi:hypothetical protein